MQNIWIDYEVKRFWNEKKKLKRSNWKAVWSPKMWEVSKETESWYTIIKCNDCKGKEKNMKSL